MIISNPRFICFTKRHTILKRKFLANMALWARYSHCLWTLAEPLYSIRHPREFPSRCGCVLYIEMFSFWHPLISTDWNTPEFLWTRAMSAEHCHDCPERLTLSLIRISHLILVKRAYEHDEWTKKQAFATQHPWFAIGILVLTIEVFEKSNCSYNDFIRETSL